MPDPFTNYKGVTKSLNHAWNALVRVEVPKIPLYSTETKISVGPKSETDMEIQDTDRKMQKSRKPPIELKRQKNKISLSVDQFLCRWTNFFVCTTSTGISAGVDRKIRRHQV
jgi:hypothetical protein